jgi:hypothetical protein
MTSNLLDEQVRPTLLHTACTLRYTLAHAAWADAFPDL